MSFIINKSIYKYKMGRSKKQPKSLKHQEKQMNPLFKRDNKKSNLQKTQRNKKMTKKVNKQGRPINYSQQKIFMTKVRGAKLQTFNAQTQLQIQMNFFTNQRSKQKRKLPPNQDLIQRIMKFQIIDHQDRLKFRNNYYSQQSKWKFQNFQGVKNFPNYLFADGSQLSYILYRFILIKRLIPTTQTNQANQLDIISKTINNKFTPQQLFFICLLCLNDRKILRSLVLDFLISNSQLIIQLIKFGIQKLEHKHQYLIEQQKRQKSQSLINDDKSQIQNICQSKQESRQLSSKSKKIQKNPITTKQKIKKKTKKTSQDNDQGARNPQQKEEKLIFSFVNFICWSYCYVYAEEGNTQSIKHDQAQQNNHHSAQQNNHHQSQQNDNYQSQQNNNYQSQQNDNNQAQYKKHNQALQNMNNQAQNLPNQ